MLMQFCAGKAPTLPCCAAASRNSSTLLFRRWTRPGCLFSPKSCMDATRSKSVLHARVRLSGGRELKSETLAQHLGSAQEVLVVICTIGSGLEELANQVMETEMIHGLALYGAGSAAVEALANAACQRFEAEAAGRGWHSTIPLSPGMIGWSVAEGQPQIFSLLDASPIGVHLTNSAIMLPLKSLSLVIGLGPEMNQTGTTCDYCALAEVCKYQRV